MCGRYFFSENIDLTPYQQLLEQKYDQTTLDLWQKGEVCPSQIALVKLDEDCDLMRWNYQLFNRTLINTRIESIRDKQFYRQDYQKHRCVVVASGFYEWKNKQRHYLYLDDEPIYLAAIYQPGQPLDSFSIITKEATTTSYIHDRIPVVLNEEQAQVYLKGQFTIEQLIDLKPAFRVNAEYENLSLF